MNRPAVNTALLVAGVLFSAAWAPPAAAQVTAILTADNHYGLYHGGIDGEGWTFVGRNEMGSVGDPGAYNWTNAETFEFDAFPDDHIYVVAWDEDGAGL